MVMPMNESEVIKLLDELRSYDRRFIFQGGSSYARGIAEEIERLRYVNRTLAETIDRLMAENGQLHDALQKGISLEGRVM